MNFKASILCFLIPVMSGAQNLKTWDLRECIEYALSHNLTIKQRETSKQVEEISLQTAKNSRLPGVSANASESFNFGRSLTSENTYISRNTQNTSMGINLSVPIFTGFQIPNQIALSRLNLQAAIADLEKAKEDMSIQVTSAYLQVLYTKELKGVSQKELKISQEQLYRLKVLLANGKISEVEVSEAHSRVAQDSLSMVQAINNYQLALLDLSQLLELSSPEGFSVAEPMEVIPSSITGNPEEIYQQAIALKPAVKAEELRLKGTEKNILLARSGYYPTLSFGAGMNTGYYKTSGMDSSPFGRQLKDNWSQNLGISLSIPIFNRFETRDAIRKAKVQRYSQELQLESVKKTLYKEIQQAYYNAVAARAKYQSGKVAERAATVSFELVSKKYENGKATATEFNESKTKMERAIADCVQAKYDYLFRTKILAFYRGESLYASN